MVNVTIADKLKDCTGSINQIVDRLYSCDVCWCTVSNFRKEKYAFVVKCVESWRWHVYYPSNQTPHKFDFSGRQRCLQIWVQLCLVLKRFRNTQIAQFPEQITEWLDPSPEVKTQKWPSHSKIGRNTLIIAKCSFPQWYKYSTMQYWEVFQLKCLTVDRLTWVSCEEDGAEFSRVMDLQGGVASYTPAAEQRTWQDSRRCMSLTGLSSPTCNRRHLW